MLIQSVDIIKGWSASNTRPKYRTFHILTGSQFPGAKKGEKWPKLSNFVTD